MTLFSQFTGALTFENFCMQVKYNKTPYNNFQKLLEQQSKLLEIRDPYKSPHEIAQEERERSRMMWVTQKDFQVLIYMPSLINVF